MKKTNTKVVAKKPAPKKVVVTAKVSKKTKGGAGIRNEGVVRNGWR